ncbi:alpha-L-fucosidase [Tamlana fucoidanivorans]|uniref:alpha-L-fucosidase n=1 Tax=Allotamlana fucoidanivorans TaxID=2583814 RepID=A0A5C4SF40_9FLAO|nr:alpha-L-fucosidase [Tamlana fucoidanivorans]TNJ42189.1 alpha-L-fucosidase [Tamlana fucoidanivorans]
MKSSCFALLCFLTLCCNAQKKEEFPSQKNVNTFEPSWESLKQHQTPEWFLDAKFGIYFHWGVYSYMGKGEWYSHHMYEDKDKGWNHDLREHHLETYGDSVQYYDFFPKFTAQHFDAAEWAELFKKSGAKFVGPVAEHCDYFSNWNSKVNPYNSVNYGPKLDIVGELEKAIKAKDLKFVATFHHSWEWGWYNLWNGLADTTNIEFRSLFGEVTPKETFYRLGKNASGQYDGIVLDEDKPSQKFIDLWKAKIHEVIDQYKPDLLWFDSRVFLLPEKDRKEMVAYYYNKALKWDKEVVLTYKNEDLEKGVGVIDLEKGRFDEKTDFPWLTDDSYAWNGWSWRSNLKLKTPQIIIQELVDISSKNGCLLLNITPTHDGKIPEKQREGLLQIGKWLTNNGEAIYKTRPYKTYGEGDTKLKKNHFGGVQGNGVTYKPTDFRFTQNKSKDVLYVIQLDIPEPNQEFTLTTFSKENVGANEKIKSIELLGSNETISWRKTQEGLKLKAPKKITGQHALVYKVNL